MADGKVVISTELDNSGILKGTKEISGELGGLTKVVNNADSAIKAAFSDLRAGSQEMEGAVREAANAVEGIGDKAKASLQKQVDVFAKQNALYAQQRKKVDELQKKLSELYGKEVETEAFEAVNAEVSQLDQKMNALIDKQARFAATGGDRNSRTFQRMEYDLEQIIQKLKAAESERQKLLKSGGAYKAADTSAVEQQFTAECERLRLMNSSLVTSFDALNAKLSEYGNKLKNGTSKSGEFSSALSSLADKVANTVKEMRTVKPEADSANENLSKGSKSILKYAFGISSLYVLFNMLRSAVMDGFKNLVQFDDDANRSASTLLSSLTQLKNSLATAFAPILTAVTPALTTMINLLSQAANYAAMLMAALGGKSTYTKAIAVQEDYAASLKSTGSAAKGASKSLAGFDEITRLNSNDSSGSGGGASVPNMFETDAAISSELQTVADMVREVMGAFEELYNFITGKITFREFIENLTPLQSTLVSIAGCLTAITVALVGMKAANVITAFISGAENLEAASLFGKIAKVIMLTVKGTRTLSEAMQSVFGTVGTTIAGIGAIVGGVVMAVTNFFSMLENGFNWLNEALMVLGVAIAAVGAVILGAPALVAGVVAAVVAVVATIVVVVKEHWEEIKAVWDTVVTWFDENVVQPVASFFSDLWDTISGLASGAWEAIKEFFAPAIDWFSELWNSVGQTFSDIFYNIGVIASGCWEVIKAVWSIVSDWFSENIITPVSNFFTGMWDGLKRGAAQAWEGVKSAFSSVGKFFGDIFRSAWEKVVEVFSPLGKVFMNIRDGILSAFKSVVNGLITGINNVVAVPFNGINSALNWIKGINIMGITPFSGLRTINVPQIPYLAKGAVLPANKPFLAMVGDQTHGTNIEAPLSTIQEAVAAVMDDYAASNLAGHEATVAVLRDILEAVLGIQIGDDVIARATERYQRKMAVVTGGNI